MWVVTETLRTAGFHVPAAKTAHYNDLRLNRAMDTAAYFHLKVSWTWRSRYCPLGRLKGALAPHL